MTEMLEKEIDSDIEIMEMVTDLPEGSLRLGEWIEEDASDMQWPLDAGIRVCLTESEPVARLYKLLGQDLQKRDIAFWPVGAWYKYNHALSICPCEYCEEFRKLASDASLSAFRVHMIADTPGEARLGFDCLAIEGKQAVVATLARTRGRDVLGKPVLFRVKAACEPGDYLFAGDKVVKGEKTCNMAGVCDESMVDECVWPIVGYLWVRDEQMECDHDA